MPPFYHQESNYGPVQQREALIKLRNTSTFSLWKPLKEVYSTSTDHITLPDLPDLESNIAIDALVNELSNLQRPHEVKFTKDFWEYVQYALISLVVVGLALLVFWIKCCKGRLRLNLCMAAMGNRKNRQADRNQTAGEEKHEAVATTNTGSVDSQPREVQREVVDSTSARTLVLELATPNVD